MTEREIESRLVSALFSHGAEGLAFGPIVAAAENSAQPHASARDYAVQSGDALLIDFGARAAGFCADITRTFFVGHASDEASAVYETVRAANQRGHEVTRAGITAHEIDDAVQSVLEASPYADRIRTKTGHGLGREVHEAPYIMRGNDQNVPAGAVFTNEPGLYDLESFGVRIEDDILVTEDGCRSLTTFPRELRSSADAALRPLPASDLRADLLRRHAVSFAFIRLLPGDPIIVMAGERGVSRGTLSGARRAVRLRRAALEAVLRLPPRHLPGRSRHLLRDQAPGARRVLGALPRDAGAVDLRHHPRDPARHPGGRDRGGEPRQVLRPGADDHRARRLLDADLLVGAPADHRVLRRARLDAGLGAHVADVLLRRADRLHADRRAAVGRGGRVHLGGLAPDPADDRARDDPARHHRPADPLGHARGAGRGLRPHRPRQGPRAAPRQRPARAAQRADPGHHRDRPARSARCSPARS